jgi:hypothetical protein
MRDDFPADVKQVLAFRVSTTCSNPQCLADTAGPQEDPSKAVNVGVAAHITSAAEGGPRFNPNLTPPQRGSAENGIWLCQTCAKLIDNDVTLHPEELLRAWKTMAEHNARMSVGKTKSPRFESEAQKKAKEIQKWQGKQVMLVTINTGHAVYSLGVRGGSCRAKVIDCTEFWVQVIGDNWDKSRSIPLNHVELGFNDQYNCLEILEKNP